MRVRIAKRAVINSERFATVTTKTVRGWQLPVQQGKLPIVVSPTGIKLVITHSRMVQEFVRKHLPAKEARRLEAASYGQA